MRTIAWLFVVLLASPVYADVTKLVNEGTALHDSGRYDEAIAKFKAALEEDPSSILASYELALTYQGKGDTAQCVAILEPLARTKNKFQAALHAVLGNCYDIGGDPQRAIATYRKGLKIDGKDTQLLYNLAVTLAARGDYDEARKLLKQELALVPTHRSGHYLLGQIFEAQNFRIPAALSFLRFLSLEPVSDRAKDAAARAIALLGAGIEVKDKGNVNITIDSNPRKEEGDYSGVEMMMAFAGTVQLLPENENKSEFEKKLAHVSKALAMIVEAQGPKRDYTSQHVIPFFRTLYDKELLDAFAAAAISSLWFEGSAEWSLANPEAIHKYAQFIGGTK